MFVYLQIEELSQFSFLILIASTLFLCFVPSGCHCKPLTDWLIDWLTDWLIDCETPQFIVHTRLCKKFVLFWIFLNPDVVRW